MFDPPTSLSCPLGDSWCAALTLDERLSLIRSIDVDRLRPHLDDAKMEREFARWISAEGFASMVQIRAFLDAHGIAERELRLVLGLNASAYAELSPQLPQWALDLDAIYGRESEANTEHPDFSAWARSGANDLAGALYPIIDLALQRFRAATASLVAAPFISPDRAPETLFLTELFDGLLGQCLSVLVFEMHVARHAGRLAADDGPSRFREFCAALRETGVRLSLLREYPMLFRSLLRRADNWATSSAEILLRLDADWDLLREKSLLPAGAITLKAVKKGFGDEHRGGRTVAVLDFSDGRRLVYKPRSCAVDRHFHALLAHLNAKGLRPALRLPRMAERPSYGWVEFIESAPCADRDGVDRFYQRMGALLAVLHVLKGTDMHCENVIAAGEFPVPIDLECLFHQELERSEDPALDLLQSSVMRTLLLPRNTHGSDTREGFDLSGLGGTSGRHYPEALTFLWEGLGSDDMRLVPTGSVPIPAGTGRPRLGCDPVAPAEFSASIVAGFARTCRLIHRSREELLAPRGPIERFTADEVRYIARDTSVYMTLRWNATHPDFCRDSLDRELLFSRLWLRQATRTSPSSVIAAERDDLLEGDVPFLLSRPDSTDLWTSRGRVLPSCFENSAFMDVQERMQRLDERDLLFQTRLIGASLASCSRATPPLGVPAALARRCGDDALSLAVCIGETLCNEALESEHYANWIGLTPSGPRERTWSIQALGHDLYSGLCGCALFLAFLGEICGDERFTRIARKAIALSRNHSAKRARAGLLPGRLGAFMETGGHIYALTHLGVLWKDQELLGEARVLATALDRPIATDQVLDVLGGCAGLIPVLRGLDSVQAAPALLQTAIHCGERLLECLQEQEHGAAWTTKISSDRPLTGFSHGAAGIAWSLLKLADWSRDDRFSQAAARALEYERATFSAADGNWPDFRSRKGEARDTPHFASAWCHGAPGIALGRLDSAILSADERAREEIRVAAETTLASGFGYGHGLCHGDLGNLEILRLAAARLGRPDLHAEAEALGRKVCRQIATKGPICGPGSLSSFGMLCGLSGVGYGLLRMAAPQGVPCVLTLAPPLAP